MKMQIGLSSLLYQKNLLKQVLNQFWNINKLTTITLKIFLKNQNSQRGKKKGKKKKTLILEFWKLGVVFFCTVKTFFQFGLRAQKSTGV